MAKRKNNKIYIDKDIEVEKVEVLAQANILDAKVEIQGADELIVGENIIKITVTSANGDDAKEYTIKVTKQEAVEEITEEQDESNEDEVVTVVGVNNNNKNNSSMGPLATIVVSALVVIVIGVSILAIVQLAS